MGDIDDPDVSEILKEQPCTVECPSPYTSPALGAPASRQVPPELAERLLVQRSQRVAPSLEKRAQVDGPVNVTAGRWHSVAVCDQSPGKAVEVRSDAAGTALLQ
jgi:hypothetical protein